MMQLQTNFQAANRFGSKRFLLMFVLFALGLVFPLPGHAQRYLGAIQGQVSDATGAKVAGAKVTATEATTKYVTAVTTTAEGAYAFPALQPGSYTVMATAPGFRAETLTDVVITAGQSLQLDISMQTGSVTESVTVSADQTTLLDTGSPNVSTTLSQQEVTDLPNNGRNPFVMATMAAGVTTGAYMQSKSSQFTNPYSGVSVQISSNGNSGHNRLTLDGIPNDPPERLSGATYAGFVPSPEAVQEVKVQTSIFDAQVGHGNGALTNTVVRNGTNSLHGSAYYVFQNTYLDANLYEKAGQKQDRNNNQVNQTGLVIDGPVVLPKIYNGRNKTFFLFAFERYATHTPLNYNTRVPTAAELGGDFSALCNTFDTNGLCTSGIQVYDPQSPVDANGNRTAYFANNNIASRLSDVGKAFAAYYPAPNVSGSTAQTVPNYISTQTTYPATDPSFIGRFDQAIGQRNKLNVIGFRSGLTQSYPLEGYPNGVGPSGYGYSVHRDYRGGAIDDVHQFSDTVVLDSRFGLMYHPFGLVYPGATNFDLSSVGITTSGLPYNSFPGVGLSDSYSGLAAGAGGQVSASTVGSLAEILTKMWSRHTVRFGFEGNVMRYGVQNPMSGFGAFGFDRRFTQQNVNATVGSQAGSGDPLASLMLGAFSSASYNINIAYALQQIYAAPFVQDDWRLNSRLTLNLGLRWDYEGPITERFDRMITNFCVTCANPLQQSVTGLTLNGGLEFADKDHRLEYPRDMDNWQPRLGLAWQATRTTVVRAGYGIIYFNTIESPSSSGFSQSTSYTNTDGVHPINSITDPFPAGVTLPTGSSLGLATALGQGVSFPDQKHVTPKSTQFTLNVQQALPGNLALQIGYVGARPTDLEVSKNINALPVQYYDKGAAEVAYLNSTVANPMVGNVPNNATLNAATIQQYLLLLPYPEFGSVTENFSPIGSAPYDALQVQVSKPMKNNFSLQGNFTWNKVMVHTSYLNNGIDTKLSSVQDGGPTLVANVWGTYEFPKFEGSNYATRLVLGGWKLNGVMRAQNGNLIGAPGTVDIIGPVTQRNPTYSRYFNTCYEDTNGNPVASKPSAPACDGDSPTPAYRQRLAYTLQHNSTVINVRQRIHPLVDASLFKVFKIHERTSFEIRGEFFNVLNTPNFGGPGTGLGSSTFGVVTKTQANDPRIGQLTGRINF